MSNFLGNKGKKFLIAVLAVFMVTLGIPKVENAVSNITASPLYSGSDRTTGEILQSDLANGKKIKFTVASNVKKYKYSWNLNIGGEQYTSSWLNVPSNRIVEVPVNVYSNGKNVPLGLLELSISTWDGVTTPSWFDIPYYVVSSLTPEANRDRNAPVIRANNFTMPANNEENPIIVKNGEGKYTLNAVDLGYKGNSEKSTGIYCFIAELVKEVKYDEYTANAKVLYNRDTLTIGYGNDVDIKLPTQKGQCYVQMYAIDGSNNPSNTQWVKFDIRDDIVPPQISINSGANGLVEQFIELNGSYVEYGATARDDVDGNITAKAISSTIDTKKVGTYKVTYEAVDSAGNKATAERTVYVVDKTALRNKIREAEDAIKNPDYSEDSRNKVPPIIDEVKDEMDNVPQDKIPELIEKIQKVLDELKVANPRLQNIKISTNKGIDEETNKYYLKSGETLEIAFNTGVTEINSVEALVINGRKITDKTKIKLEKLDGFNYKITYTLTNEDNEIAEDGLITYGFTVKKQITVNGKAQSSVAETGTLKSSNIIFDKTAPEISFPSDVQDEEIYFGEEYRDAIISRIAATNERAKVTVSSDIETALNVEKLGTQVITYKAVDKAGNETIESKKIKRNIKVKDYIKKISFIEAGSKTEYEYNQDLDLTKTNIKVEMASGAVSNKTLAVLKQELGEDLKIEPTKLSTVTDTQKITVNCTAYGNRTEKLEFNVKVTKASIPNMPGQDEIEWNPDEDKVSYDASLNSYVVTYDKNAHKLELDEESINKLPQNVKIERYEYKKIKDADGKAIVNGSVIINDGARDAGTYEVKIVFSSKDDNFRAPDDVKAPATLTVIRANQVKPSITLNTNNALLGEEAPRITSLGETPEETPAVKYTSSNAKVLTINDNGEITLAGVRNSRNYSKI